jgi:sialidase-1
MANKQVLFCGCCDKFLDKELTRQSNKANGGIAFRIPSIVNANGVLVAVIDRATSGSDWGYIELAVRRSEDNGKTWSELEVIASPPAREIVLDTMKSAFFIDPCMTVADNGDIVMLVTFFPECKGIHNRRLLDKKKPAYAVHEGKKCPVIYDKDGNYFLVLDDGTVIDKNKAKTEYKVTDWQGSLYKGDEYVGNIYLNGAVGKTEVDNTSTTFGAPLKAPKRSYIFSIKSSDQGKTWSEPKNITGDILLQSDSTFLAIAPGTGLTTKSGRIIMPLYTLKNTVSIYSDDNGETWQRNTKSPYSQNIDEWTAIEAPNGRIYSFGRARLFGKTPVSFSDDNGISWNKAKRIKVKAPRCQKNSIVVGNNVYISHPTGKKRENGVISKGTFEFDKKGNFKGIKWNKKDEFAFDQGFFAYSCMAKISNNQLGVFYEAQPSSYLIFETVNI